MSRQKFRKGDRVITTGGRFSQNAQENLGPGTVSEFDEESSTPEDPQYYVRSDSGAIAWFFEDELSAEKSGTETGYTVSMTKRAELSIEGPIRIGELIKALREIRDALGDDEAVVTNVNAQDIELTIES